MSDKKSKPISPRKGGQNRQEGENKRVQPEELLTNSLSSFKEFLKQGGGKKK